MDFGTQGEQEINFSLVRVNFEAVFGRWFECTIDKFRKNIQVHTRPRG